MVEKCRNCHTVLMPDDNYCGHCGQSVNTYENSFLDIVKTQLHELLDIDGRMTRTLKVLVSKPGELSLAFNAGQRVHFSPPLRLYLAISILFFLLYAYLGQVYSPESTATGNSADYYAKAMFVLFPIFALLNQIFFQKSRFLGNLVFSMHIHSFVYMVLMVIAPLEANESRHIIFIWLQLPPALYLAWYYFMAFKHVYQQNWWMTAIKAWAIFMIYMALLGVAFDVVLHNFMN